MIFGDAVRVPDPGDTISETAWVAAHCVGEFGTVGWFVPDGYPEIVRVPAPSRGEDDWWASYRRLVAAVAVVGARHTGAASEAWFGVWVGHGWESSVQMIGWTREPVDEAERIARERQEQAARIADRQRRREVTVALATVPRFGLPHREYYVVTGPVTAASELRTPGQPEVWQRPDLWWPADRAWFVATDVDFWSLYVGGSPPMVADLREHLPVTVEPAAAGDGFRAED